MTQHIPRKCGIQFLICTGLLASMSPENIGEIRSPAGNTRVIGFPALAGGRLRSVPTSALQSQHFPGDFLGISTRLRLRNDLAGLVAATSLSYVAKVPKLRHIL